jgi:hypothetical protein
MTDKTVSEVAAAAGAKVEEAKAQWSKTRQWRHDRWESIKADPAAATCVFLAGVAVAEIAPLAVKLIGWVLK